MINSEAYMKRHIRQRRIFKKKSQTNTNSNTDYKIIHGGMSVVCVGSCVQHIRRTCPRSVRAT